MSNAICDTVLYEVLQNVTYHWRKLENGYRGLCIILLTSCKPIINDNFIYYVIFPKNWSSYAPPFIRESADEAENAGISQTLS